jgi:hypothetical protein
VLDTVAVSAMTSTDDSGLTNSFSRGFLALVNQQSAFGRIPFMPGVFNMRLAIEGASDVTPSWVAEGGAKPLVPFSAAAVTLRPAKLVILSPAIGTELARSSDAVALTQRGLTRRLGIGTDVAAFLPTDARSLTFGATEIPVTANPADDVAALLAAISGGAASRPFLVLGAAAARTLAFSDEQVFADVRLVGVGSVAGVPQVTTSAPALSNFAIAVDADGIVVADGGIELDQAEYGALQMQDDPTVASSDLASPPSPVATSLVSLFQTNSIVLKATRFLGWARPDDAIAFLDFSGSPA